MRPFSNCYVSNKWVYQFTGVFFCMFVPYLFIQGCSNIRGTLFIYYEKAKKVCKISTVYLSYVVPVKYTVEILQKFVAFSEYMNFTRLHGFLADRLCPLFRCVSTIFGDVATVLFIRA